MRYGVRIGESVVVDELVADGVYECVYIVTGVGIALVKCRHLGVVGPT